MERIISFLCVIMFTTLASKAQDYTTKTSRQIYKYNIRTPENSNEVYVCGMSYAYLNDNEKSMKIAVMSDKNISCAIAFKTINCWPPYEEDKFILRLYLKNGEVLTTNTASYEPDDYFGISGTFSASSIGFISNKKNNFVNELERGKYVMSRLRLYDIIKISYDDNIIETPNFWSSATIDAMCKDLMAKTGDQGQYGSVQNVSTSKNQSNNSGTLAQTLCPDNNHPHMIDLGLPSGTKWACCNVGANKPEAYGDYYTWGDCTTRSTYNEITYKHYINSYNYQNLGKDIAGTQYDVAHVKWGGSWQMPSLAQRDELLRYCTYTWTTKNGINGGKFTGKNGKSIFLPAAGEYINSSLLSAGRYGCYWVSSQGGSYTLNANYLSLSGSASWNSGRRWWGLSVRPVAR
jgi:hypothetical protein